MATTATLVPGQNIAVNKYNVQVERYLSQGGFAHVYLVRTATPVYNTTHHVLKRIAVPNEGMLTEVKQEVDVMRLLKGHPNIVHLIDAAWHRLPNGTYEVFILMEFCPGGGIIDMMNRRLRERLTEAEILTIFVDVCEGVAHMHNSRPPLLHRDLKVENILQASATSYKLCDFGSAATELRALEADLNRHTTLQYRAPEMVDLYLRRPVDEKSDVWALGVLLYKLCYYTTPFEEHGPLAILNVSYKIPPYPVYSPQMNALIASMLREHGTHRPSVFELLTNVHRLRGTVSSYHYNHTPTPQPLSPRTMSSRKPVPSPHPLDSTISYRAAPQVALGAKSFTPSPSPSTNAGLQARDKGRPMRDQDSGSTSSKEQWLNDDFGAEEEKAWKSATMHGRISSQSKSPASLSKGFGDDFAAKLWDEFESGSARPPPQLSSPRPYDATPKLPARRQPTTGSTTGHSKLNSSVRSKDAFEGLGLSISDKKPAPTLGEARKLRTGLAVVSPGSHSFASDFYNGAIRPSVSPRPSYLTLPDSAPLKPSSSGSSWSSQPPSSRPASQIDSAAEARFPSLEELDAKFGGTSGSDSTTITCSTGATVSNSTANGRVSTRIPQLATQSYSQNKVRSEQVMSATMQEALKGINNGGGQAEGETDKSSFKRPGTIRKRRSSVTRKPSETNDLLGSPSRGSRIITGTSPSPSGVNASPSPNSTQSKDWLTGDDESESIQSHFTTSTPADASHPVLRQSSSKRASFIEKSGPKWTSPTSSTASGAPSTLSLSRANRVFPPLDTSTPEPPRDGGLTDNWSPVAPKMQHSREVDSSSSADEGPEEANRYIPASTPQTPDQRERRTTKEREKERESTRVTITPKVPVSSGGDSKTPQRRLITGPSRVMETKSDRPTPSASPAPLLFPSDSLGQIARSPSMSRTASSQHTKQTSAVSATPPTSSRSRPQSMFVFPSKAPESPSPSSVAPSGLSIPEERTPRPIRRTSITDMVQ
ncbi:kinase-like domain-containing protein, partial [Armillaria novae-zelandiae]